MELDTRTRYDAQRNFETKGFRAGCYAPFVSLLFNTLGDVAACCRSQRYVVGNLRRDRLDDIWNGQKLREMREGLANYKFSGACEFCEWAISAGDYEGAIAKRFEHYEVPSSQPDWPQQMEFGISNVCNFACIQCDGLYSSTIRAHREKLPALAPAYDDHFFTDLRRYLPHLKLARFAGGEPFLARENFRIWDMLIEDGLTPKCAVVTNGSQWNDRVERVLDALNFTIAVSLDAINKEALERIRVHSDHAVVTKNLQRFRDYTRERGTKMAISFSLMPQNWQEVAPMLLFAEEQGIEVNLIRVVNPAANSLFSLPSEELARIVDALEDQDADVLPKLKDQRHNWVSLLKSLRANCDSKQADKYTEYKDAYAELLRGDRHEAEAQLHAGRPAEAREAAERVATTDPNYFDALVLRATASRRLGELDVALALANQAVEQGKRNPGARISRAWTLRELGRTEEARADADQALALLADSRGRLHAEALRVLTLLAMDAHDTDRATELAQRLEASAKATDDPSIQAAQLTAAAPAWMLSGRWDSGRWDNAMRVLDLAQTIDCPDRISLRCDALRRASHLVTDETDPTHAGQLAGLLEASAKDVEQPALATEQRIAAVRVLCACGRIDDAARVLELASANDSANPSAAHCDAMRRVAYLINDASVPERAPAVARLLEASVSAAGDHGLAIEQQIAAIHAWCSGGRIDEAVRLIEAIDPSGSAAASKSLCDAIRRVAYRAAAEGDSQHAPILAEQLEASAARITDPNLIAEQCIAATHVWCSCKRSEDAMRALAMATGQKTQSRNHSDALRRLGHLLADEGDSPHAPTVAKQLEASAEATGDRELAAEQLKTAARIWRRSNRPEEEERVLADNRIASDGMTS